VVEPFIMVGEDGISDSLWGFLSLLVLDVFVSSEQSQGQVNVWKKMDMAVAESDNLQTSLLDVFDTVRVAELVDDLVSTWFVDDLEIKVEDVSDGVSIGAGDALSLRGMDGDLGLEVVNPLETGVVLPETVIGPGWSSDSGILHDSSGESEELPGLRSQRRSTVTKGVLVGSFVGFFNYLWAVLELVMVSRPDVINNMLEGVLVVHVNGTALGSRVLKLTMDGCHRNGNE
jgi:hypothetical protein